MGRKRLEDRRLAFSLAGWPTAALFVIVMATVPGCSVPPPPATPMAADTATPPPASSPNIMSGLSISPTPPQDPAKRTEAAQATKAERTEIAVRANTATADAATAQAAWTATSASESAQNYAEVLAALSANLEPLDLDTAPLYAEPPPIFTQEQLVEARQCTFSDALAADPQSACEWAAIANAVIQSGDPADAQQQEIGRQAYGHAVQLNPAFALRGKLYYHYFDIVNLTGRPPDVTSPIITILVAYFDPVEARTINLTIVHADTAPLALGFSVSDLEVDPSDSPGGHPEWHLEERVERSVSLDAVQNVTTGLTDLMPFSGVVPYYLDFPECEDTLDVWYSLTLILSDGTYITAKPHGAFMQGGGPWVVQIGDRAYLQTSSALTESLVLLANNLGVWPDEPNPRTGYDLGCNGGNGDDMLDELYPKG